MGSKAVWTFFKITSKFESTVVPNVNMVILVNLKILVILEVLEILVILVI